MTSPKSKTDTPVARRIARPAAAVAFAIASAALAWLLLRDNPRNEATTQDALISQLPADVSLAGTVHNTDGQPIVTAQICAYGASPIAQLDRNCATTDAQGRYRLSLSPGPYSVTASASNYASRSSAVTLRDSQPMQVDFTLDEQAPTLAGIVSSASGERLGNARVTVLLKDQAIVNVLTNQAGEFSASTPAGSFVVKAEADGFGASLVSTAAPTLDLRITLFPGNVVAGRVLLQGALQPMPNVRVIATSRPDRVVTKLRDEAVLTDAHGSFTFDDLPAGEWLLSVAGPNVSGTLTEPVRVSLDRVIRDLTIFVQPARAVSGRFVVGDGTEPCPMGRIQFLPAAITLNGDIDPALAASIVTAMIDEKGKFEVAALPHGDYTVSPECKEHQFAGGPLSLSVGEQPIEALLFKFLRGVGVDVRVVDEAQQPIAQAVVSLNASDETGMSRGQILFSQRNGITDASGRYRFGGLFPGGYRLAARYSVVNDGKSAAEESVVLQAGVEPETHTLTLPSAGTIRIRARTAAGEPVSRILFFALDSAETRHDGTYSGDGKFNIGPLPRESYRVFAYDNKNPKIPLNGGNPVVISKTGTTDLDFKYSPADGQIKGRVVDHTGAPMPGTLVRAISAALDDRDEHYARIQTTTQGAQELMTDREGRFRIDSLNSQSTYDLHVSHPDGLQEVRHGIQPDSFVEVAFPAGSRVEGNVVDSRGKPLTQFGVLAVNSNGIQRSKTFKDTNGHFTLDNVMPGDVQIAIFDDSSDLSAERKSRLAAGQSLNIGTVVLAANDDDSKVATIEER